MRFEIISKDDETQNFKLDGKAIGSTNHDEDGWQGMQKARDLIKAIAKVLGAEVVER